MTAAARPMRAGRATAHRRENAMKAKDMLNLKVGDLIRIRQKGEYADEGATIAEVTSIDVTYRPGRHGRRAAFNPAGPAERDGSAVMARTVKVIGRYQRNEEWQTYPAAGDAEFSYSAREVDGPWTPEREAAFMELRRDRRAQRIAAEGAARQRRMDAAAERAAARDRLAELVGDEPIPGFSLQLENGDVRLAGTELVKLIELALARKAAR